MLGQPHPVLHRSQNALDFGSAALGDMNGNGWTRLGGTGSDQNIELSSSSISGKRARIVKTGSDGPRLIQNNAIGSVAAVEILVLMHILAAPGAFETTGQILLRGDASDGDPYYICLPRMQSGVKKLEIGEGNGSGGGAALSTVNKSWDLTNFWWQRFRANSTALKGKMWQYQTPEPAAWDIETTDATLTSGVVGLGMYYITNPYAILWFSVATGGNTAPAPGG